MGLRFGIEFVRPTPIGGEKLTIYAKDGLFLVPASVLILFALRNERLYRVACAWADFLCTGVAGWAKACASGIVCAAVAVLIYRTNAQIIDEAVYLFQAHIFSAGQLAMRVPSGLSAASLGEYVAIRDGRAAGIFFPGQSLVLLAGLGLHLAWILNPLLTALLSAMTYRIGLRLYTASQAGIATALFLFSPFVVFQGASYFPHILSACLFCGGLFVFLFNARGDPVRDSLSGLLLGALCLQRPLSAAVLLLCLALNAAWMLEFRVAVRRSAIVAAVAAIGVAALLLYNHAITGNALQTPHDSYFHHSEFRLGMNLPINTMINLAGLSVDLFGVPVLGLLPLGYLVLRFSGLAHQTRFLLIVCAIYVAAYGLYDYHGLSYGPRFWFELVPILCLLTADALCCAVKSPAWTWFAGNRSAAAIFVATSALVVTLGILPARLLLWSARAEFYSLPTDLAQQVKTPAVVFLKRGPRQHLNPQIAGLQHDGPIERTPMFFLGDTGLTMAELHSIFPGRSAYCLDLATKRVAAYPCAD